MVSVIEFLQRCLRLRGEFTVVETAMGFEIEALRLDRPDHGAAARLSNMQKSRLPRSGIGETLSMRRLPQSGKADAAKTGDERRRCGEAWR